MRVTLADLWSIARERDPGFLDDVLEHSKLDYWHGAIELSDEAHKMIDPRWPKRATKRGLGHVPYQLTAADRQALLLRERENAGKSCC